VLLEGDFVACVEIGISSRERCGAHEALLLLFPRALPSAEKIGSLSVSLRDLGLIKIAPIACDLVGLKLPRDPRASFREENKRHGRIMRLDYAPPQLDFSPSPEKLEGAAFSLADISYVAEFVSPLCRAASCSFAARLQFPLGRKRRGENRREKEEEDSFLTSASGFSSPDELRDVASRDA